MNTDDTVASTLTPPTDTPVDAAAGSDTLWITKEGGNRRMPFDQARLERTVHSVHGEFPQLDVADYLRSVLGADRTSPAAQRR